MEHVVFIRLDQCRIELISCRLACGPEVENDGEEVSSESERIFGCQWGYIENKGNANAYKNAMNHSAAPATDRMMLHLSVGATPGVRRRQIPLQRKGLSVIVSRDQLSLRLQGDGENDGSSQRERNNNNLDDSGLS